jgi:hypothetical protein
MIGRLLKHITGPAFAMAGILLALNATADRPGIDLLADPARQWRTSDPQLWSLSSGSVSGESKIFDGDKTDPAATTFLVSEQVFGGDVAVTMKVSFQKGRYIGVYLDFGQESQSGIWMATGHALAADAPANEIERGYIKTVDDGFWIVRTSGELVINGDEVVRLRFARQDDDYSLYQDDRLIATYRKPGGYPAGRLQIRLTNASVRIHELKVESDWSK